MISTREVTVNSGVAVVELEFLDLVCKSVDVVPIVLIAPLDRYAVAVLDGLGGGDVVLIDIRLFHRVVSAQLVDDGLNVLVHAAVGVLLAPCAVPAACGSVAVFVKFSRHLHGVVVGGLISEINVGESAGYGNLVVRDFAEHVGSKVADLSVYLVGIDCEVNRSGLAAVGICGDNDVDLLSGSDLLLFGLAVLHDDFAVLHDGVLARGGNRAGGFVVGNEVSHAVGVLNADAIALVVVLALYSDVEVKFLLGVENLILAGGFG